MLDIKTFGLENVKVAVSGGSIVLSGSAITEIFEVGANPDQNITVMVKATTKELTADEAEAVDITSVKAAVKLTVSDNASVTPENGETVDFTKPVTFTVTAENGKTKEYTVTVKVEITGTGTDAPSNPTGPIPTPTPDLGITTIELMDKTTWDAITDWQNGKPAYSSLGEGLNVTQTEKTIKVTGTLSYVQGFTDFDKANTSNQSGYYVPLTIALPANVTATSGYLKIGEMEYKNLDLTKSGNREFALRFDTDNKVKTVVIDWDGDGEEWETVTYTIDVTGCTFDKSGKTQIELMEETTWTAITDWNSTKPAYSSLGEGLSVTQEGTTIKVTGRLSYVQGFTDFDKANTNNQSGYYVPLTIALPANVTATSGYLKIGEMEYPSIDLTNSVNREFALRFDTAHKVKEVVIDWDGDGGEEWNPVTYTINTEGCTFDTSIRLMDEGTWTAITDWQNGKPAYGSLGEGLSVTQEGATIKVTGTLKYVQGFTDFDTKDASNQSGYYVPLIIALPADVTAASSGYLKIGEMEYPSIDLTNSVNREFALRFDGSQGTKEKKVKISWSNGNGTDAVEYTINITGCDFTGTP